MGEKNIERKIRMIKFFLWKKSLWGKYVLKKNDVVEPEKIFEGKIWDMRKICWNKKIEANKICCGKKDDDSDEEIR